MNDINILIDYLNPKKHSVRLIGENDYHLIK